jgi:hypothetical protein
MKLVVKRYGMHIECDDTFWSDQEEAYIEDTLGLKNDGDAILLVRKNAHGLSCPAYLETKKIAVVPVIN